MNQELVEQLKAKMPDFTDTKKLTNLEVRAEKHHEREGRYTKKVFTNLALALVEIETKLKAKYKLAKELCRSTAGTFTIIFELPAAESEKVLESALQSARKEYENWITQQQEEWLDKELSSALQEQAELNAKKQEKQNAALKASLLKALQTN